MTLTFECASWSEIQKAWEAVNGKLNTQNEILWYRGCRESSFELLPTLMRDTQGLSDDEHHQVEADLFYEFQARAGDLSKMRLTDWECLFFARHHSLPTRLLDWTDTFGTALYFSVEYWQETVALDRRPAVWVMNPYQLNEQTWEQREIISPKYLGIEKDGEYWDFG